MNAALSWLLILSMFVGVLLITHPIGQGFDWLLDRMRWGSTTHGPTITDEWCPCATDRSYHSRITETKDLS